MDGKIRVFGFVRIAAALAVLVIGLYFAISKEYFDTSYNKIDAFDKIEPLELQQGDVLEQAAFFDMDKINSIGICAVNRTNNCIGQIDISLVDGNNNVIWKERVNVESLQLQRITWFKVIRQIKRHAEYTLVLSTDEMEGTIYIGAIDAELNSEGVRENVIKNGTGLKKAVVVESTFYARLDKGMRLLILVWTIIFAVYIVGFRQMFCNKKRGVVTLILTADILAISIYFRVGFKFYESLNYVMFAGLVVAFFVTVVIYFCYRKTQRRLNFILQFQHLYLELYTHLCCSRLPCQMRKSIL